MISVKNLNKKYGTNQILSDINIDFEKGKVYGIVGKNGAGKSTLFRCLAGLETHDGEVESEYSNLKNHIGFLETNPKIMSRLTGWEYLKLLSMARKITDDDFDVQNIFDLPLSQYAEHYSTGMKKKLALLGVIIQKNDVFIFDEPFNGVDIQSNIIIIELIAKLRSQNKIVIIASHIFSTLSETCDKIFLMDNGFIKKDVSPEKYAELETEMKKDIIKGKMERLNFSQCLKPK